MPDLLVALVVAGGAIGIACSLAQVVSSLRSQRRPRVQVLGVEQVRHEMRVLGGRRWIRWAGTDEWMEVRP
jgi:hypothetical protein